MGPWTFAWICSPQLPYHPCKNGTHSTCLYSTGGHMPKIRRLKSRNPENITQPDPSKARHPHVLEPETALSRFAMQAQQKKNVYQYQSPPPFYNKAMQWGKMAGTNEFALCSWRSICTGGGGPESGRKKFRKCLPAGTGTKIYFSRGLFSEKVRQGHTKEILQQPHL